MAHPSRRTKVECATCGAEKTIPASQHMRCKSGNFFCSPKCKGERQNTSVQALCATCGREISVQNHRRNASEQYFCSVQCAAAAQRKSVSVSCPICGVQHAVRPCHAKTYNDHLCRNKSCQVEFARRRAVQRWSDNPPIKVERPCAWCGEILQINPSKASAYANSFCGDQCRSLWMSKTRSADGNRNWKGGLSFEPYGPDFNDALRSSVRERDLHMCQMCGGGSNLQVHHIDYDKNNNVIGNLILLCASHHAKTNFNRDEWRRCLTEIVATVEGNREPNLSNEGGATTIESTLNGSAEASRVHCKPMAVEARGIHGVDDDIVCSSGKPEAVREDGSDVANPSEHKGMIRLDGKPSWPTYYTPPQATTSYRSPFVVLATRA